MSSVDKKLMQHQVDVRLDVCARVYVRVRL